MQLIAEILLMNSDSKALPQGGAYSVTVGGNNPAQNCTVSNGSGAVSGSVVNIGVVCQ